VDIINTVVTSKDEILRTCREIVAKDGLEAVNMRDVAKKCNIALGSLYYYFSGKDDLVLETIESVWQHIFHMDQQCSLSSSFNDSVKWIFESIRNSADKYPNFLTTHSLGFATSEKGKAKNTMEEYLKHMRVGMAEVLNSDTAVRKDAFSETFSEKDFIEFVLSSIIGLLLQQKRDCSILLEVIRRTIY
jgi:AcrR family transcriptional regulator